MRDDDRSCSDCRRGRPAFNAARASFAYEGPVRDAVHSLKYYGVSALAADLAKPMAATLTEWAPPVSTIVPVPVTGHRRRMRGYNQAELLAREVSRLTGITLVSRVLRRRRDGTPQAQQRDQASRRENVSGAFALGSLPRAGGVLLIDDVMTTGATLDACARALLEGGAGPIYALAFARED